MAKVYLKTYQRPNAAYLIPFCTSTDTGAATGTVVIGRRANDLYQPALLTTTMITLDCRIAFY